MRPSPLIIGNRKRLSDSPEYGLVRDAASFPPADGGSSRGSKRARLLGYGSDADERVEIDD